MSNRFKSVNHPLAAQKTLHYLWSSPEVKVALIKLKSCQNTQKIMAH